MLSRLRLTTAAKRALRRTSEATSPATKLLLARSVVNSVKEGPRKGKEQGAYFDFVEHWSRDAFFKVGYGATAGAAALTVGLGICQESVIFDLLVAGYWALGYHDINQKSHTVLRNFPVLGNARYLLEMLRPEIRQVCFSVCHRRVVICQ